MIFVFCADPESPRDVEEAFQREARALDAVGGERVLIDHDALVRGDTERALRRVPSFSGRDGVYRGWMVTPEQYAALHAGLAARGLALINDPAAYRLCHHLPESYPLIEAHTPRTVWIPADEGFSRERIRSALAEFGARPLVLKDYVKSVKHDWEGACFIPSAEDDAAVARVVANFLEWQGEDLNGGLVFREAIALNSLGPHPQSGMPLTEEYRALVLDGRVVSCFPYWESASYVDATPPPQPWLEEIAAPVASQLFTLDVARRADGGWVVIELGDGQVAGLPAHADVEGIVGLLARRAL